MKMMMRMTSESFSSHVAKEYSGGVSLRFIAVALFA